MYWAGRLPIHLLNGTFHERSQSWPREEVTEHNYFARRLFPPLNDNNGAQTTLRNSETEGRVQKAFMDESKELGMHPDMHKVYWSRPAGIDKVSHYVLLVNGHKYELRDVSEARDRSCVRYRTAEVEYNEPVKHMARVRDLNSANAGAIFELLLIGWTTFTHEEINRICDQAGDKWTYTRVFRLGSNTGNCQHFVRKVAEELIVKKYRATNWGWFRHDRMGPIQLAQRAAIDQAQRAEDHQLDSFNRW
ncbi:hypothetical protein FB567DRAFT_173916 [Paraphoma chrysanthemicola]|uniref:PPPDE domain-containing protein n=1 Tax=Paraphoma chrysanthemicola TaxID=798071 RepID=A0A8K0RD79_9PLEO|nr:hypothetical protein FB567DRAFT_173916 [Paraphoma chrysanthemicola]